MNLYDDVVALTDRLSVAEKVRLIRHLENMLRNDLEAEAFRQMQWHEFLRQTYGTLSDDPMERPEQLPLEEREQFE